MSVLDGCNAFPIPVIVGAGGMLADTAGVGGMTIRDYFAGQALVGNLSRDVGGYGEAFTPWYWGTDRIDELAKDCYKIADAMLAARSPAPPSQVEGSEVEA